MSHRTTEDSDHCEACGAPDDGTQTYCEQCGEPLVDPKYIRPDIAANHAADRPSS
jgi:predicted amidophosphoribosyltransferase